MKSLIYNEVNTMHSIQKVLLIALVLIGGFIGYKFLLSDASDPVNRKAASRQNSENQDFTDTLYPLLMEYYAAINENEPLENLPSIVKEALPALVKPDAAIVEFEGQTVPLLGRVNARRGFYAESVFYFKQYYALVPTDPTYRREYIEALLQLRLYDVALEQFRILENTQPLTSAEQVNYIKAMVQTGNREGAKTKALQWFKKTPEFTPEELVEIAILLDLSSRELQELLHVGKSSIPSERSLEQNIALLRFWVEHGDYTEASQLVKAVQPQLEKSTRGLYWIAQLNDKLSNSEDALKYAKAALKRDPNNTLAKEYIETVTLNMTILNNRRDEIEKKLRTEHNNISLQMDLAQTLIDLALEKHRENPSIPLKDQSELRRAYVLMDNLTEKQTTIPRLYLLLGESAFLLENTSAAIAAFNKALALDPSYVEVYKYQAMLALELHQPDMALKALGNALHFAPLDVEVWQDLAKVYHTLEDGLDAINSLERVIKFQPNEPLAYIDLAKEHLQLENPEVALVNLNKAIALDPHNIPALKMRLITLYNPLIRESITNQELQEQQDAAYRALKAIDPKQADEILHQVGSHGQS